MAAVRRAKTTSLADASPRARDAGSRKAAGVTNQAALESWIEDALEDARRRWPGVKLAPEAFARELRQRAPTLAELRALRASDVYLALACTTNDRAAWRIMEGVYLTAVERRLARTRSPKEAAEIYDRVRDVVLAEDRASILANYTGRSSLATWLYGVAVQKERELRRANRRRARAESRDEVRTTTLANDELDPELRYLSRHFAAELKAALEETLASFTRAERALLRQHVLGDRTVDELGKKLGVHRATAARRVARLRSELTAKVHERLARRLGLDPDEAKRLRGLIGANVELSVTRLL